MITFQPSSSNPCESRKVSSGYFWSARLQELHGADRDDLGMAIWGRGERTAPRPGSLRSALTWEMAGHRPSKLRGVLTQGRHLRNLPTAETASSLPAALGWGVVFSLHMPPKENPADRPAGMVGGWGLGGEEEGRVYNQRGQKGAGGI